MMAGRAQVQQNKQSCSDRNFGFVFAIVFLMIAFGPAWNGGPVRIWSLLASGGFGILALSAPHALAPANRLWMKFGEVLHAIVSPLALGIVFFAAVLPTGLLMRARGKDPLHLRFDPQASTYWITRHPPGPTAESLNNQF